MWSGRRLARPSRQPATFPAASTKATSRSASGAAVATGSSGRATTAACSTAVCSSRAASISPGSIRKPRSLICSSTRPRNRRRPSGVQAIRSPVRYRRSVPPGPAPVTNRSSLSSGRRQYPWATVGPAIQASPGMPAGTGRPRASSTSTRTPAIGRPMATGRAASSSVTSWTVAHTVASVGPYSLKSRTWGRARKCSSANPDEQLSPATMAASSPSRRSAPDASSCAYRDGTQRTALTRSCLTSSARRRGSRTSSSVGTTRVPPAVSVPNRPATELSKATLGTSRKRPGRSYACSRAAVDALRLPWVTTTPLGRPVEPEVYRM